MNKIICLLALASLALGCEATTTKSQPAKELVVNTISCEIRGEWVDFKTNQTVYSSYGGRNSIWRFKTIEGQRVVATNCYAFGE